MEDLPAAVLISQNGLVAFANRCAGALFSAGAKVGLCGVPLARLLPGAVSGMGHGEGRRLDGLSFAAAWTHSATTFQDNPAELYVVRSAGAERTLEARLQRHEGQLRQLSARMIETQERERRHIARELHDEIGQCLSAIRVQFATLQRRTELPEALALIGSAADLTERTLGRVRSLALLLHPPQLDTLGLRAALRWHIREQERLHDWRIRFNDAEVGHDIPADLAIAVYRIVQESLSNALLHGRAQAVCVDLTREREGLKLQVVDDGCGFDPEEVSTRETPTLGLMGMTERARLLAGSLTIASTPGEGTRVTAVFPRHRGAA
jgi:signal transduction histidine kinase